MAENGAPERHEVRGPTSALTSFLRVSELLPGGKYKADTIASSVASEQEYKSPQCQSLPQTR
jgi:hypothetical protein